VTQKISAHRVQVDNRQVVLLDTPGFDDTFRSDAEVLRYIADWLAISYIGGRRLTAILYLHRITDPRMAGSSMRNLTMFKKLIGDDALDNVVLVTTMWNQIDQVKGAERERELLDTSGFWGRMVSLGSSVARFDGTRKGAYSIIQSQLNKTTRTLNIQKEMIDEHLQLADTEAGKEVLANITELKLKHQREISGLRSDMEEALSQNDRAAAEALAELSEEYDRKLAIAQAQIDALQSRNPEIEALQIRHEQEMKSLKDSLEDRMRFLEEQASAPPPAYAEAGITSDEDVRDLAQSATSHNTNTSRSIIFHLWTLFICFGRLIRILLRPRVHAGYRRLEWTCVCFAFLSQCVLLII
jgi:hypothetical protein